MVEAHHARAIDDEALQLAGKADLDLLLDLEGEHFSGGIGRAVVLYRLGGELHLIGARRRGRARKRHLTALDRRGKARHVFVLGIDDGSRELCARRLRSRHAKRELLVDRASLDCRGKCLIACENKRKRLVSVDGLANVFGLLGRPGVGCRAVVLDLASCERAVLEDRLAVHHRCFGERTVGELHLRARIDGNRRAAVIGFRIEVHAVNRNVAA